MQQYSPVECNCAKNTDSEITEPGILILLFAIDLACGRPQTDAITTLLYREILPCRSYGKLSVVYDFFDLVA